MIRPNKGNHESNTLMRKQETSYADTNSFEAKQPLFPSYNITCSILPQVLAVILSSCKGNPRYLSNARNRALLTYRKTLKPENSLSQKMVVRRRMAFLVFEHFFYTGNLSTGIGIVARKSHDPCLHGPLYPWCIIAVSFFSQEAIFLLISGIGIV